jgi:hypothetical protein
MRRILVVTSTMVVGIALLSCTTPQPSAPPMAYEPPTPVVHEPLPPPVGYVSPPSLPNSPTPVAPYANAPNEGAEPQTAAHWRASPRWAAVKGEGCIVVEQDPQAKFADQSEAAKVRVENCSKKDADDLTPAQPEELSGY